MASSHVIVLDSALKRTQIKVTPGRYMREVLEEACKSRKLDPEAYVLKTQSSKLVDLSQPFRLCGLAAGAKLQLVQGSRSPTVVTVALQLPDSEGGGKLVDKFPSTTSLWLVLRKYEDAVAGHPPRKLNLTQRAVPTNIGSGAGRLEYEQPCLNIMGRGLEGFSDLQKSLSQLGLTGSVLIRLSFKSSGLPLEEAMRDMEQYFAAAGTSQSAAEAVAPAAAAPSTIVASSIDEAKASVQHPPDPSIAGNVVPAGTADNQQIPDVVMEESVPDREAAPSTDANSEASGRRTENTLNGIAVFSPPSCSTPAAALQEEDASIFEPGIEHAKAHQAALQRASRNTRLLSDAELAEQASAREAELAAIQSVKVRVRYSDQSIIETTITATDSAADLYTKVSETLAHPSEPYELRFAGPKGAHQVLPNTASQRLVRDFGFRGSILLTLVWAATASLQARQNPSLKETYRSRATELKVELQGQREAGQESHRTAMAKPETSSAGSSGKSKVDLEAKMKKFLGFGKK
jgi:tether containing UBX domain for GLUT4